MKEGSVSDAASVVSGDSNATRKTGLLQMYIESRKMSGTGMTEFKGF